MRQTSQTIQLNRRSVLMAASAFAVAPTWAQSPAWNPTRPIKLIVPFPAGGGADVSARQVTEQLGQKLGQAVVIDNRAGGGGMIGGEIAFRAAPDGYTLLWATSEMISAGPHLWAKLPFKPLEFVPVGPTGRIGFVMVTRPDLEAKTFPQIVELARKRELTFAAWGSGTGGHVGAEMIRNHAKGTKILVVPYQGAAPAMQAVVASQVDVTFMPMPLWLALNTKVTTVAVAAKSRYERMKDVPTTAEFGVPIDLEGWQGVFAPPQTPRVAVERISKALAEVMAGSEVKGKYESMGVVPPVETYEDFVKLLPADTVRLGEMFRLANVQPQ